MFVYGLYSPEGDLRYVGKTSKVLRERFLEHIRPSCVSREINYKNNWVKSLLGKGQKPIISVIQTLNGEQDLALAEQYWIAFFRAQGCNLTNGTSGGEGISGYRLTETHKQAISKAQKGRLRTKEETELNIKHQPNRRSIQDQFGRIYQSTYQAASQLGLHRKLVGMVAAGKRKSTGGFTFTYVKE